MGKGRRSLETCWFLVSCSDWPNLFMSTDSRCCWQYCALSMSRSYYSETIQISLLDFAHPSAPRRETNIYLWSVRKRKTRPSKCGFFLIFSCEKQRSHFYKATDLYLKGTALQSRSYQKRDKNRKISLYILLNACCIQLSLVLRERVDPNCTARSWGISLRLYSAVLHRSRHR